MLAFSYTILVRDERAGFEGGSEGHILVREGTAYEEVVQGLADALHKSVDEVATRLKANEGRPPS
jgi:hypothetical protein